MVKPFATKNNRNEVTVLHHRLIQTTKVKNNFFLLREQVSSFLVSFQHKHR